MEDWRQVMKEMSPAERRAVDVLSYLTMTIGIIILWYNPGGRQVARYCMYVLAAGTLAHTFIRPELRKCLMLILIASLIALGAWLLP